MKERPPCPYCSDSVSGESVRLWDGRDYCRDCVENVSPELYAFVMAGGRLEETVEKADLNWKNMLGGAGKKTFVATFLIFMAPFVLIAILDKANARNDLLIGLCFFCAGFIVATVVVQLLLAFTRRMMPRTVAIESGQLLVITPENENRIPLFECKWRFGGVDRDGVTKFTGLKKGIVINHSQLFVSCGHAPEMLKYWGAFLVLAGVRRKSYWDAVRIFLMTVSGILMGILLGWGVGHVVALITQNPIWVFALGFLGAVNGLGVAFNYAYFTSYGFNTAHKKMNASFLGGAFFVVGFKVGIIAGVPTAFLCAGVNGALGVMAAWFCRLKIRADELRLNVEEQFACENETGSKHGI